MSPSMNATSSSAPTLKTPHKPAPKALGANPNAPDSTNLKNFFQNLLNKNAPLTTPVSTNQASDNSK